MTTIHLHDETKARLDAIGSKGDSYDDIVRELLETYEAGSGHDGPTNDEDT